MPVVLAGQLADWLPPQARQAPKDRQWLDGLQRQLHAQLQRWPRLPGGRSARPLAAAPPDPSAWPLRSCGQMHDRLAGRARNHRARHWPGGCGRWRASQFRPRSAPKPTVPARAGATAGCARADRAAPLAGRNPAPAPGCAAAEHPPCHPARSPWARGGCRLAAVAAAGAAGAARPQAFAQPEDFCPARFAEHEASRIRTGCRLAWARACAWASTRR